MRQSDLRDSTRSMIAVVVAIAFGLSPLSALAEQTADNSPDKSSPADDQQAGDSADDAHPDSPGTPAGPTPKLFVLPTQSVQKTVSDIIPRRIGELLRSQLQANGGVDLLATYDKLQKAGGGQANAAVAEAKRLYTSGIGLLTAGKDKKASELFQKAVNILEKNPGELDNFGVLTDAYRNMALAYFNAGFDFDGRKKMKIFAQLRPQAKLDDEKFPKELRDVFQKEAAKVERGGPGRLEVDAPVDEAEVSIDGSNKATTPATIDDVGYGRHYLVVRAPDGRVWTNQIQVLGRDKSQTFQATFKATATPAEHGREQGSDTSEPAFYSGLKSSIESGRFGEGLQPYLAELRTRTGADFIAWVAMLKRESAYVAVPFVYRVKDAQMVRAEDVAFNIELSNLRVGVTKLARHLADAVDQMPPEAVVTSVQLAGPVEEKPEPTSSVAGRPDKAPKVAARPAAEPDSVVPPPNPPPSDGQDDDDTWFWVGTGGAVVLVGAVVGGAVYALGNDSAQSNSFDAKLTW